MGFLETTKVALSRINKTESRPNRCLTTSFSSCPPALAMACPNFLMRAMADSCQPPNVSTTRGWKTIPSAKQASPYFLHFWECLCWRAYPGSAQALSMNWAWRGLTTATSQAQCLPPAKKGRRTSAGRSSTPGRRALSSRSGAREAVTAL